MLPGGVSHLAGFDIRTGRLHRPGAPFRARARGPIVKTIATAWEAGMTIWTALFILLGFLYLLLPTGTVRH